MANKTVYPYGTGGSLPSNIGIVNDLHTGGADKALSAEQGVVLNNLSEHREVVDLSSVVVFKGTINSSGAWGINWSNLLSVQIPVKPGQVYRIIGIQNDYTFYSFFTDFSLPVSGNSPSYPTGVSGRISIPAGGSVDVTVPSGASYLYLATKNNSSDTEQRTVYLVEDNYTASKNDNEDLSSELYGQVTELCNYETDAFTFTGSASQGAISKVGSSGYLLEKIGNASGVYYLYTLPSGLVSGRTYLLSFNYKAWLSTDWSMNVVTSAPGTITSPQRAFRVPATGSGRIAFRYTYLEGDIYLRLPASNQSNGCGLLIENLSIVPYVDTISSITKRLDSLDGGQNLPNAPTFSTYLGRRIDLTEHQFGFSSYMDSLSSHQSSACYGDYLFTFNDRMSTIKMYNIRTKTLVATVTQSQLDTYHHCNQAFFGTEFYEQGDVFPLVYISVKSNWAVVGGSLEAYRIVPVMGDTDYLSFTITKVQTITAPAMTDNNALGEVNFAMDTVSGYLYAYSRNDNQNAENYNTLRITRWNMPKLSAGDVTLPEPGSRNSWETGVPFNAAQGATIRNHLLFVFGGYSRAGYIELCVFDLIERTTVATIDLMGAGFTMEPEGAFFWGNTLCTSNTSVFRFFFKLT